MATVRGAYEVPRRTVGVALDPDQALAMLEADSATIAACARGRLDAPVPLCPGWKMADLVQHVGGGQRWIEAAMRLRATEERDVPRTERPGEEGVLVWFEAGVSKLLETARAIEAEASMRMLWNEDGVSGGPNFLRRRAMNEAAIHRWDAENVVGRPSPIPAVQALDGLDELLVRWLPWAAAAGRQAQGKWHRESVLFRTDGAAWRATFESRGRVRVEPHGNGPATCSVGGPPSALLLFGMNRGTPGELGLAVEGDDTVLARWRTEVRFGSRAPANPPSASHSASASIQSHRPGPQ